MIYRPSRTVENVAISAEHVLISEFVQNVRGSPEYKTLHNVVVNRDIMMMGVVLIVKSVCIIVRIVLMELNVYNVEDSKE